MIRLLWIFIVVATIATGVSWLADRPGNLVVRWLGWEVQTSFAIAFVTVLVFIVLTLVVYRLVVGVWAAPGLIARKQSDWRRRQGFKALTKGLIAVASGEVKQARRYSGQAERLLEEKPLTNLLGAQAAQLDGDEDGIKKYFHAMLDSPDTAFLGLRGLTAQAQRGGDRQAALEFAGRAFDLRPKTTWAFEALVELQSQSGDWDGALGTLEKAKKAGSLDSSIVRRWRAGLLTAKAYMADRNGKGDEAENDAVQAHHLMPSLAPAAVLAARKLCAKDNDWKAAGILEEAWREAPHPSLVEAYVSLKPNETAHERAKRLHGLAQMNPKHMESQLLMARQSINTRKWQEAREVLKPLVDATPTARVCALMAEIEQGDNDNVGGAREWLARAVAAPPEPEWVRASFNLSTEEWSNLARQIASDLNWPPALDERQFAKGQVGVAPFTPELQMEVEKRGSEHDKKRSRTDRSKPVLIIESPPAVDHVPVTPQDDVPPLIPDVPYLQKGSSDAQTRHTETGFSTLRSVRKAGAKGLRSIGLSTKSKIKRAQQKRLKMSDTLVSKPRKDRIISGQESDADALQDEAAPPRVTSGTAEQFFSLPQQPDDPGPHYNKIKKKHHGSR